jgi:integrase
MANISKRGARWRAEVCIDRKRKSKTFDTKREARAWSDEQEAAGLPDGHTLRQALEQYRPISKSRKGAQSELSRLKVLEAAPFADTQLVDVTPAMVAAWRDARLGQVAPVSVRRELIILSAIFRTAVREWGWCRSNPCSTVTKPMAAPPRRRGMSDAEIAAACERLERTAHGRQVAGMLRLSVETGMRLGEICGLRWADIEAKVVTLPQTKNGDARRVPLSEAAREVIASRRGIDPDAVFTLAPYTASQVFRRAARSAGLVDVHFHDARSEAVTRLARKLDVMQLARMIGHRDLKSLMIYYAEKPEDIADRL